MSDPHVTISRAMQDTAARAREVLDPESHDAIVGFLHGGMNADGGWRGRSPASDLYYSLFGLSGLHALGAEAPYDTVRGFVASFGDGERLDFVHLVSLVRCMNLLADRTAARQNAGSAKAVLERIEGFRAPDGGYRTASDTTGGSVYGCFLACLAYEACGRTVPAPERMKACLESLRRPDGGYGNAPGLGSGTTTATGAGLLLRRYLGQSFVPATAEWLLRRACPQGGFLAGQGALGPDLLSTAVALFALQTVEGALDPLRQACREFIESLWDDSGGFVGHAADPVADPEYTYYAILALGALAFA